MIDFPPEIEDEFKELLFALENTERGGWFFAVYKQWKVAEELIARLKKSTELPVFEWQYSQEKPSYPVDYLQDLSTEQKAQRAIVMLFHVASGGEKVIKSLDFNRERFADFPHCLLFWVTETELREIANGAGHFWAQRGGRFDFSQVFIPSNETTLIYQSFAWGERLLHIENYKEAEKQLEFYLSELVQTLTQNKEKRSVSSVELYDKIAYLLFFLGRYSEAILYCQITLNIYKWLMAIAFNDLKAIGELQGIELNLRVYYRKERYFKEATLLVAGSLNNLAVLFVHQKNYKKAFDLVEEALEIVKNKVGKAHPFVAITLNNLAYLYSCKGWNEEALDYYNQALLLYEKQVGKNHLEITIILNNLAASYTVQSDYKRALPFYQRALDISQKQLEENHPDVAVSLNNLAGLYYAQGRYNEALSLYQRSLAIFEKSLGAEHPDTKIVAKNYAGLLGKMSES